MQSANFFAKNLNILQKHYPMLADAVASIPTLAAFKVEPDARLGADELYYCFADGSKKAFHEGLTPKSFAVELVKRFKLTNPRIMVFFGFGLGLHLLEYLKKPDPINHVLLIIEPHPSLFKLALEHHDFSSLFERKNVYVALGQEIAAVKQVFEDVFFRGPWLRYANAIEYIPHPSTAKAMPDFFKTVQEELQKSIAAQYNRLYSDPFDCFRGFENVIKNLPAISEMSNLDQLGYLFKGKSGVVIASGPSLALSLPYLKNIQDKAILVACPSAIPALKQAGIKAHIWVNIERIAEQAELFCDYAGEADHLFVASPLVHPDCFKYNSLNAYMLGTTQQAWLPFNESRTELGHSSAHAAFIILQKLGCEQVYLVGQDLCYHQDNSHAASTWQVSTALNQQRAKRDKREFSLMGYAGHMQKSNAVWVQFLSTFVERLIPAFSGKVFHVTPQDYGVQIKGTQRIDPAALDQYLSESVPDILSQIKNKLSQIKVGAASERKQVVHDKIAQLKKFLVKFTTEANVFSLKVKRIQFSPEVSSEDPARWQPVWDAFCNEVQAYSDRYLNREPDKFYYRDFLRPLVQGMLLRYQIDYFTRASEREGDFGELNRKLEILFHMAKDEAYWATQALSFLDQA